ncbi:hypothetical protein ACR3K2_31420 [Cryptosporidium serpentis]
MYHILILILLIEVKANEYYNLRGQSILSNESPSNQILLKPVEFNNITDSLKVLPFEYYGYITRLSYSNLNPSIISKRIQELYPFLINKKCGKFHCVLIYNPDLYPILNTADLAWLLSYSTISSYVSPELLQFSFGLPQVLYFGISLAQYEIVELPVKTISNGTIFGQLVSNVNSKDEDIDLLLSPCDGVLQYIWPNVAVPVIPFMLVARIQCNIRINNINK